MTIESPGQTHKKAERDNKDYRRVFTAEVAKSLQDAGFSIIHTKTILWFLGVVGTLVFIIYGTLLTADSTQAANEKADMGRAHQLPKPVIF